MNFYSSSKTPSQNIFFLTTTVIRDIFETFLYNIIYFSVTNKKEHFF
uniref:Uncharacterized protein n=1 Tax=viral metagenome TaxID=1070528 RepID=A0A6C0ADN1_9ZZZZ